MGEVDRTVGENLRRIRKDRQLTLAAMAALCDVSSSMLGQIERGVSSPTVATLHKLVSRLQISYDELLCATHTAEVRIADAGKLPAYRERAGKYRLTTLIPYERSRRFEQVYAQIYPGQVCGKIRDEAYTEYAAVQQGELLLRVENEEYHLSDGQSVRIPRGAEHVYCNRGAALLTLLITLSYEEL